MLSDPEFQDKEPEDQALFVDNVLAEVKGKELRVTCDLVCSRVIEQLLGLCSADQLQKLFSQFVPLVERMLVNR
jgi:hypothetical protein